MSCMFLEVLQLVSEKYSILDEGRYSLRYFKKELVQYLPSQIM